jgi:hypothetical protein
MQRASPIGYVNRRTSSPLFVGTLIYSTLLNSYINLNDVLPVLARVRPFCRRTGTDSVSLNHFVDVQGQTAITSKAARKKIP